MHSSDKNDGAKKHSFKRWGIAALFLAVCILANAFLNYALIPPSTVRINLHNLRNGMQYDTVFLGTSHGQYGIDPRLITPVAVSRHRIFHIPFQLIREKVGKTDIHIYHDDQPRASASFVSPSATSARASASFASASAISWRWDSNSALPLSSSFLASAS